MHSLKAHSPSARERSAVPNGGESGDRVADDMELEQFMELREFAEQEMLRFESSGNWLFQAAWMDFARACDTLEALYVREMVLSEPEGGGCSDIAVYDGDTLLGQLQELTIKQGPGAMTRRPLPGPKLLHGVLAGPPELIRAIGEKEVACHMLDPDGHLLAQIRGVRLRRWDPRGDETDECRQFVATEYLDTEA